MLDLENGCLVLGEIDRPRISYLKFSPKVNYLITWETFHGNHKIKKKKNKLFNF